MSSQKIVSGSDFNEGAALVRANKTGGFSSLSSDIERASAPAEAYRFSVDPTFAPISVGAATDTLVAGVPGRAVEVLGYTLITDSETQVVWKSGSTNISGTMTFAANAGATVNDNEPVFRTNIGEGLAISNSAGNVNGHLTYRIV